MDPTAKPATPSRVRCFPQEQWRIRGRASNTDHSFRMPAILLPTCSSFGCSDLALRPRATAFLRTKVGQPIHRLLSFHPASLPMLEGEPVPKSGFKKPSFLLLPPLFPPSTYTSSFRPYHQAHLFTSPSLARLRNSLPLELQPW